MASVVNTNVYSINAQKNLSKTQMNMGISMQRLSSGLRINSAKDDAAGLGISERMGAQIRGLNQAIRNANDGISLAQTAESNLVEITNSLQRMRELATQSANGVYSTGDRESLQKEVSQLQKEIGRILQTSNFNGRALFYSGGNGFMSSIGFQIGANTGFKRTSALSVTNDPNQISFSAKATYKASTVNGQQIFTNAGTKHSLFEALKSARVFSFSNSVVNGGTSTYAANAVSAGATVSIVTQSGARLALNWLDKALDIVNEQRSTFGALQGRFESVISNLSNNVEALEGSRSRIRDADFAKETANMTKSQILQQAGIAMLSQANAQPQSVLSLLG